MSKVGVVPSMGLRRRVAAEGVAAGAGGRGQERGLGSSAATPSPSPPTNCKDLMGSGWQN